MPTQITTHDPTHDATAAAARMILTRSARTHLDALDLDEPPRLLIVGTAGSGKSVLLRELQHRLADAGFTVMTVPAHGQIPDAGDADVVILDDAHLATDEDLDRALALATESRVGLVVASRPWPLSSRLAALGDELEQVQPALVLGHLTRTDVAAHLTAEKRPVRPACLDGILDFCGHLTWLVTESLALHDDACDGADDHAAIRESLRDLVAHRIATGDPRLRAALEELSLLPRGQVAADDSFSDLVDAGYARGLLQRNGVPAPVVREAVRATVPIDRLRDLYASSAEVANDPGIRDLIGHVTDPRVASALIADGDLTIDSDPSRAGELYAAAQEAGADADTVLVRRARAAWAAGDVDGAGAVLDGATIPADSRSYAEATAIAGAVWAARGDLAMSSLVYDAADQRTPEAIAHATIAAVGSADAERVQRLADLPTARSLPSTLVVAQELLTRGLRSTLTTRTATCLSDLVRASEMHTAASCSSPVPEIPAVLAAVTALNLGELAVAHSVVENAVRTCHGGGWAQSRLLLWQAWIAMQQERPHEAEAALKKAESADLTPRDRLMADAVSVALTRRYADSSALLPAWRKAKESILRTPFDLYTSYALGEFVVTAARVGDTDPIRPQFDALLASVHAIGDPPAWSAPLHWAGLHASILLNRPAELTPHARALVAASTHTRLAGVMAHAGRVWTDVLAGTVDADAIEESAQGLASVGLAWDGARLAGHGAGRTEDRRVISRLLACARQLHPREQLEQDAADVGAERAPAPRANDVLSAREREVAELVLQGKTYAEIGDAIFISPRTAEHHIARIRRRLGASNRSDLIAKLRLVLEEDAEPADLRPVTRREFA